MRSEFLLGALVIVCWASGCRASEPVCFRTPADAAEQTGVRGVSGYWLESANRDVYAGTVWAVVKSCEHPERPGVVVFGGLGQRPAMSAHAEVQSSRPRLLQAGARVQVVIDDGLARLQMSGIALAGGAAGDPVRVRLIPASAEQGTEQFATGVVRGSGTVEVMTK